MNNKGLGFRFALLMFMAQMYRLLHPPKCEKEALGYRCRHNMHSNNIPECGAWSKVRGY